MLNAETAPPSQTLFDRVFLEHPREAGEAYGEHLLFTLKVAGYLLATSVFIVIHGLIPYFHQTTASRRVFTLAKLFRVRVHRLAAR